MDEARLNEIRARVDAATSGPWEWREDREFRGGFALGPQWPERISAGDLEAPDLGRWVATCDSVVIPIPPEENDGETEGRVDTIAIDRVDAAFIAHARTDVPDLLDALAAAHARIVALERVGTTLNDGLVHRSVTRQLDPCCLDCIEMIAAIDAWRALVPVTAGEDRG